MKRIPAFKEIAFIAIASTLLSAFTEKKPVGTTSQPPITDTSNYAIIPYDSTESWLFSKAKPTDLNAADLKQLENLLEGCVGNYNKGAKVIHLKNYKRQYIPVIRPNGDKVVWVNCFCNALNTNWRTEPLLVKDGGNCYFSLLINLTKNNYDLFMVNDEA